MRKLLKLLPSLLIVLVTMMAKAEASTPIIEFFTASTVLVKELQPVRLNWQVRDAVQVDIYDGFRNVTYSALGNQNYIEVWPEKTANFVLLAYGEKGELVKSTLTISWEPLTIDFFQASTLSIKTIQPVRLSWRVKGARQVDIYDEFRNTTYSALGNENFIEVWPERTASYTLRVYGQGQLISQVLTIRFDKQQPIVNVFRASFYSVLQPRPIILSWQVDGAVRTEVAENSQGRIFSNLPFEGSIEVLPYRTTTYTLSSFGPTGQRTQQNLTIEVQNPLPFLDPSFQE